MNTPDTLLRAEPRPAVCAWCGQWFYNNYQHAQDRDFCSISNDGMCAVLAYNAKMLKEKNEASAAAKQDKIRMWLSRQLIDLDIMEHFPNGYEWDTQPRREVMDKCFGPDGINCNAWLSGGPGSGKTSAAHHALIVAFNVHGQSVARETAPNLLSGGRDSGRYHKNWEEFLRVDVLLIDDLDKAEWQKDKGAQLPSKVLWQLLDERLRWRKYTIITANVSGSEFAKYLYNSGVRDAEIEPVLARLHNVNGIRCAGIRCDGKNLRREAAKGDA